MSINTSGHISHGSSAAAFLGALGCCFRWLFKFAFFWPRTPSSHALNQNSSCLLLHSLVHMPNLSTPPALCGGVVAWPTFFQFLGRLHRGSSLLHENADNDRRAPTAQKAREGGRDETQQTGRRVNLSPNERPRGRLLHVYTNRGSSNIEFLYFLSWTKDRAQAPINQTKYKWTWPAETASERLWPSAFGRRLVSSSTEKETHSTLTICSCRDRAISGFLGPSLARPFSSCLSGLRLSEGEVDAVEDMVGMGWKAVGHLGWLTISGWRTERREQMARSWVQRKGMTSFWPRKRVERVL